LTEESNDDLFTWHVVLSGLKNTSWQG